METKEYYLKNGIDRDDYTYDLFVAYSLCPELNQEEEQVALVVSVSVAAVIFCLCCISCWVCQPNLTGLKPAVQEYFTRPRKSRSADYAEEASSEGKPGEASETSNTQPEEEDDEGMRSSLCKTGPSQQAAQRKEVAQVVSIERYEQLRRKHSQSARIDLAYGDFLSARARNLAQ